VGAQVLILRLASFQAPSENFCPETSGSTGPYLMIGFPNNGVKFKNSISKLKKPKNLSF
jgi:hypothetical protein